MIISFHLGNKISKLNDAAQTWLALPRYLKLRFLSNKILMWNSQNCEHQKFLRNAIMLRGNSQ